MTEAQSAEAMRRAEEAQLAKAARRAEITDLFAALAERNIQNTPCTMDVMFVATAKHEGGCSMVCLGKIQTST
ncbi:hypothetical protein HAX54_015376 [Datura stramonium]|uniref:Uncharacterized protein n=1 Tax=Datura stramonium TaxID=4076 RepID=A0ABS8RZF9_DATST|nr:hypothetical protein [Datura stramonium]